MTASADRRIEQCLMGIEGRDRIANERSRCAHADGEMRRRTLVRGCFDQQLAHGTLRLNAAKSLCGCRAGGKTCQPGRNQGNRRGNACRRDEPDPPPRACAARSWLHAGGPPESLLHAAIKIVRRSREPGGSQIFLRIVHRSSRADMALSLARPRRYHDAVVDNGTPRRSAIS